MSERIWQVYLSGEIHSDWREQIAQGIEEAGLPVELSAPVTVHEIFFHMASRLPRSSRAAPRAVHSEQCDWCDGRIGESRIRDG